MNYSRMKHPVLMLLTSSFLLALVCVVSVGCAAEDSKKPVELREYDFAYHDYTTLLANYVENGLVDYAGLKEDRGTLDGLVAEIAVADLGNAGSNRRLAFYCNAYNILTLRSIVDAYPVKSIKDIDGVWDNRRWPVAGKELSLNEIEHEVLRKEWREPRIHVAINCASIGCPPLLDVPYYPDRLDSLLEISSRRFANSDEHNQIDLVSKEARLSALFDWFGDDFVERYYEGGTFPGLSKKKAAALNFVSSHRGDTLSPHLSGPGYSVTYLEYDWSLNDLKR